MEPEAALEPELSEGSLVMKNLARSLAMTSAAILAAAVSGTAPAMADGGTVASSSPAPISIAEAEQPIPVSSPPLFSARGVDVTPAVTPDTAFLADQLRAAASLPQVINNVRTWIVGMLAGLATVFLTIGGLRYLMAGGDPAEVEKAKSALKSSAVGYALAVLAPVLVQILQSLVGAS